MIGVQWDEAAVKRVLPKGVTPVKDAPGLINVYRAGNSYGFGPYTAVYFTVDVEGFDAADGSKGRWMIAGAYGPQEKMAPALREFYGFPVRTGSSRLEATASGIRGVATVAGAEVVTAEITSKPETCKSESGRTNYPGLDPQTGRIVVNEIP